MGLISCVVFFATFRSTSLSIAGALGVVTWAAFKLRGSLRDKPMSLQAWRQYKNEALSQSTDSNAYAPVVEFEHAGKKHSFKDSIGSDPPSYRIGQGVAVLYDPADPREARIDRGRWNKAVPILIGGCGALSVLLGLWILRRRGSSAISPH